MAKSKYEYTRHIFGATSSPCIASYALRRSARDNQDKIPQVLHVIERNVYMDDLYISTADVESAVNVMNSTKEGLSLVVSTSQSGTLIQTSSRKTLQTNVF